ncbi:hypothetical protein LAZ67_4002469 [Cordylochernes scorpioides]|uniref:Uncharacterized protein n=1 Tax=Cordylochernes scorpioides TaxID=51811 RepID=A0ABY6KCT5_9ARAC|nr:hypothetical protein LAZ67_4002469 [Cordylochernes scorpioides]
MYELLDICNESLRNLETIGLERNEMVDVMLIHFLQKKLDIPIRQQWELSYDNQELPSYQRALLDNGSQRSLITEKCAAKLGIPIRRKRIAVGGLGDQLLEISLALVLTKLTNNIPSFTVKKINYSHMKGLILADPSYFKAREIDVILGSDIVFNLIQEGRRNGNENEPSAIHSKLEWLVYGPTSVSERQSFRNMAHFSSELESEDLIKRFWELESIPLEEIPTKEEKDCESHYLKNVVRDESGRYIVRLPFKESAEKLGQSKSIAISRFLNLEKRLEQNENIYVQYKQFMNEYIRLGHMKASCSLQTEPKYYIPHHCILKAQPTKLRVVFDASTKTTTQISLNDLLHVGPKLQNNIFNILLKFRTNSVALVADIEKMYRQIRLHPDDIKYQTILWKDCKDLELQEYNLLTVTYGLACAPYLAIRTLHQIAHEVQVSNPRVSKIIREDFYVDDLQTGCPTVEDAKGLVQQLIVVLGSGGFVLRKWVSNETSIIEDLPLLLRGKGEVMEFNRKESGVNVLGIQWDPSYDTLNISCKSGPADIKSKRQIVSAIARIYDPCGWLSPTTVVLKLLLQEIWKLKIGWDEDIPASIQRKWNTFEREMKHFQQISIPRCIFQRNLLIYNMQMHGFCDSSELAYSAVCYLRITYENNQIETILLTAKTKVAPIKKIPIPRLELCAALMLAQLQSQTTQTLPFNIDEQFYWTDSKIVLAWITSESKKWQIFVANRVAKIQDLTAAHSWQYISGKQNPADLATRGILPSCLINSKLWWHGPVWLALDDSQGILRVGGRLRHSDLDIDQKHPMLIPKDHLVTKLIVMHYHINNLHSGTQLTLSLIRNKFWIPSGRNLIKRVLNQCIVCLKSKSKAIHQIMGDLPKNRLLPGRPFEKIGIDLAGPIQAKPMLKRSKVIFKFYIVLFVCFTTKAIHLEISSDLTAETFLAALKRFISRRGRPTDIYSDNATNFKGASNILKERWKLFKAANIQDFSAIESINWHFIPPPLTFVSNDPNDLTALTPGHFLIGNAIRHDAESDHSALNLRSRWSLIKPQRDYFWNRWSYEYLHQLQERRKWRTSHPDVNIRDLVMLKEQNKPLQWKLARIVQIFPGEDDHVRVVLLRTPKGLLKRPITKICPLPYKELEQILKQQPQVYQTYKDIMQEYLDLGHMNEISPRCTGILVHLEDTPYQRIIWRYESGQDLKEYELKAMTYGTSCALFLAIRVLKQLAYNEKIWFPTAEAILKSYFYVDDLLNDCETVENGCKFIRELDQLLQAGGFKLRHWTSNKPTVLDKLQETDQSTFNAKFGLQESWNALQNDLASLHQVQIPRWIRLYELTTYEIHGFADASQRAYAAMVYIKIIHTHYMIAWLIRDTTRKMTSMLINTPFEYDQNYRSWKYKKNTKMMLIGRELWKYVTEPEPDEEASRTIFNMKQEKALAMIALTISPSQQIHIMDCTTAREAWNTLEQVYEPKSRSRILQLKKQFISIRFEEQKTMTNYLGRLKICSDHLREAGAEMQDQDLAHSMLAGLPESYDGIIMTFSNVEDKEFTSSKVKHVLLAEYERRMARRVNNTNEALQFGTTTRKEDKKKKNFTCYKCGKEGHIARSCRGKTKTPAPNFQPTRCSTHEIAGSEMLTALSCAIPDNSRVIDSGATHQVCNKREWFTNFQGITSDPILTASGTTRAEGCGDIKFKAYVGKHHVDLKLCNVLYVPNVRRNLLSVSNMENKGKIVNFANRRAQVFDSENRIVAIAHDENGLYVMKGRVILPNAELFSSQKSSQKQTLELWHQRFCHVNNDAIERMAKGGLVKGLEISSMDQIHTDICGPMPVISIGGSAYFLTFIDDYSRKITLFSLKHKNEVLKHFDSYLARAERETGHKLKVLRSDNGLEYCNHEFKTRLEQLGIKHELTNTYSPPMNGVAERANRVLLDITQSCLHSAELPQRFWAEAVNTAAYIRNKCYNNALGDKVPDEFWSSRKPSVRHLKAFGCLAYSHIPTERRKKLDNRANRCILVLVILPRLKAIVFGVWKLNTMIFALTINKNWYNRRLDVDNAYLYGELNEEIYMIPPDGSNDEKCEGKVLKLNRLIYGLRQSGLEWKDYKIFKIKNLGPIKYLLGVEIGYPDENTIILSQGKYTMSILVRFNMMECRGVSTPLDNSIPIRKKDCLTTDKEKDDMKHVPSRELIGSLLYFANSSRPDTTFAVTKLAQFCSNPGERHWQAAKHILRYLQANNNVSLIYKRGSDDILAFSDSDWANDIDDRRSTSGSAVTINGCLVSWRSEKQNCVSLSTMESEYIALAQTTKEILWIAQILENFKCLTDASRPITIFCDNRATIEFSKNNIENNMSNYIDKRYHYIREKVNSGDTHVNYFSTNDNLADIFTRASKRLHIRMLKRLIVGKNKLTFEEITTVLTQIEACLNSRSLCPLTDDPEDLTALTAGHFLIGMTLTAVPFLVRESSSSLKGRWQLVEQIKTDFWKRWSCECFSRLQNRPKWLEPVENIKIGT